MISSLLEVTINTTMESRRSDLMVLLEGIRREENTIRLQEQHLSQQTVEKAAELESMKARLRELDEERRLLVEGLEKSSQKLNQVTTRGDEIRRQ